MPLNPGAAGSTANITGSVAVYFDPATPSVAATFSGSIAAVPTSGSGSPLFDETADAVRVLISGSHSAASLQIKGITESINVHVGSTGGTLRIGDIPGTVAVYFSPANPAVAATFSGSIAAVPTSGSGSTLYDETADAVRVLISGSHTAASLQIVGITQSINVHVGSTGGTLRVGDIPGTVAVYFSPANPAVSATFSGSIAAVPTTGSGDPIYEETGNWTRVNIAGSQTAASLVVSGRQAAGTNVPLIVNTDGAIKVYDLVTGTIATVSAVTNITNSIAVHVLSTGGTIAVKLDPGYNVVNTLSTAGIFTVTGSFEGISTLGKTLVSPSASYNFKVYAYSLTTTGVVPVLVRFTNGAGSPTELWRVALQAPSAVSTGANFSVAPPGYLFATGTNTTLALLTDTATLVHYSVSFIKESA